MTTSIAQTNKCDTLGKTGEFLERLKITKCWKEEI